MKIVAFFVEFIVFILVMMLITQLPSYWQNPFLFLVVIVLFMALMGVTAAM
jgi:hypothetical protein